MSGRSLRAVAVSGRGLVDPDAPVLAADDEGFTRGRAAFETMRVYGGRPFRFEQHLARLEASAGRIGLDPPDGAAVAGLAELALEHAGLADAVLRLYWTPGSPGGEHRAIALVSTVPEWIEAVTGARPTPDLARSPASLCVLAPPRHEVDELRREHGRRGGGEEARRGRRGLRRCGRHRPRRPGHEHLVAGGRPPRDALARGRDPRWGDKSCAPRARGCRGSCGRRRASIRSNASSPPTRSSRHRPFGRSCPSPRSTGADSRSAPRHWRCRAYSAPRRFVRPAEARSGRDHGLAGG